MNRLKVDYGIDLGTTNSAIFRMEKGEPKGIKIEVTDDIMPSCVFFNRKKSIVVGRSAYDSMKSDKKKATKKWNGDESNTFVEFKRTMGLDTKYYSSNMGMEYSSEDLSAEILKTLKSFVSDETVKSAVITVPAKFTVNQKDATKRAAKLAGIEHCELLQEPIAASMAYGLNCEQKDGYWLVFDFGGGTFDAALLKVEDGIMQVFDTEGDNYLGGKNLDYAIVDQIIIPYIKDNFKIDNILADDNRRMVLRDAMKTFAEEVKNQLSFKQSEDIISDLGDLGEDDEGTEIELDLSVTQDHVKKVLTPIFQKAVTICNNLLKRNNMQGNQLSSLILVGGPTYSPILRQMLKDQITNSVDTSVNPMTVVARGAALYASTINNEVEAELEVGTVALDLSYEATSVETIEFATIKLLSDKCTGPIPNKLFVELVRGDEAWASGKVEINDKGDVIECQLLENRPNVFNICAYDEKGSTLSCFPNEFTIIQGSKVGSAILPYNIGIEIWNSDKEKAIFKSIKNLEHNQKLPAVGVINGLKTTTNLRPGMVNDYIKIPIYQGDSGSDGLKAACFELVYTAIISGENVPALLPSGSDVDVTIKVDRSEGMTMEVFFPLLNHTEEIKFDKETVQKEVTEEYLRNEIDKAQNDLQKLKRAGEITLELEKELKNVQNELNNGDQKKQVLQHLKEVLRKIDKADSEGEWERVEKELRGKFSMLENDNKKYGNDQTTQSVEQIRLMVNEVICNKDVKEGNDLLDQMFQLNFKLARIEYYTAWILDWNRRFDVIHWKDHSCARGLVNKAMEMINNNVPNADSVQPMIAAIIAQLPSSQIPSGASGLLSNE